MNGKSGLKLMINTYLNLTKKTPLKLSQPLHICHVSLARPDKNDICRFTSRARSDKNDTSNPIFKVLDLTNMQHTKEDHVLKV